MKRLLFSPAARDDLLMISGYIAEDNPERAITFVGELEALASSIAERPRSFPARDHISPGLRGAVHGRYVILFRDFTDNVRIVRILHSARDAPSLTERGEID